jgi:hypothetical protein
LDETGLTVEEIRRRVIAWLEELGREYGDDGRLSVKEVVRSIAHLLEGLGEDATGELADKLALAGRILKMIARFLPGPD